MEPQYDIKAWAVETTVGRRVFNCNFRMLGREVKGWQLLKAVPMHRDRRSSEMTYLWRSTEAPEQLVRVSGSELTDWREAQKQLMDMLMHSMRPDLPRGTGRLAEVGDIQFVARAPGSDIPAAVQFTRGNIAVAVNSVGSVTIDVSDIAAIVDRALSEPPTKVPSLRTLAKRQVPKTVLVKGKTGVSLVKNLKKVGDAWLKAIVPDGELRRKGEALVYLSPQPGKKTVQIFNIRARSVTSAKK